MVSEARGADDGQANGSLKWESENESENATERELSNGAPEKIRTPNLLIRSQMLYPIELRARIGAGLAGIRRLHHRAAQAGSRRRA
jgi:hypothetical protein